MIRKSPSVVATIVLFGMLLAGCGFVSRSPETTGATTASESAAVGQTEEGVAARPELTPGSAGITGTLITFNGNSPIPGTVFYLTPGRGESQQDPPGVFSGADPELGDISGQSDAEGRFALADVPPGNYFLVVWAPYNWVVAVESEEDQVALLIQLEADQWTDLGEVPLDWP